MTAVHAGREFASARGAHPPDRLTLRTFPRSWPLGFSALAAMVVGDVMMFNIFFVVEDVHGLGRWVAPPFAIVWTLLWGISLYVDLHWDRLTLDREKLAATTFVLGFPLKRWTIPLGEIADARLRNYVLHVRTRDGVRRKWGFERCTRSRAQGTAMRAFHERLSAFRERLSAFRERLSAFREAPRRRRS